MICKSQWRKLQLWNFCVLILARGLLLMRTYCLFCKALANLKVLSVLTVPQTSAYKIHISVENSFRELNYKKRAVFILQEPLTQNSSSFHVDFSKVKTFLLFSQSFFFISYFMVSAKTILIKEKYYFYLIWRILHFLNTELLKISIKA